MDQPNFSQICMQIPKAELHIHIEGTFEPELIMEIASRNNITLPYDSIEELKSKYNFKNLQEFLDIYYANCSILLKERDFHDLMYSYLKKAASQGLKYAEIFFDPQTHINRGINFEIFLSGFKSAMKKAFLDFHVESNLIMCFLRDLPVEEALKVFEMALPFKNDILAVGLDSAERGYPPELFKNVFEIAKANGFRLCCHAGEEGPAENIQKCIDLGIERIDHGIRAADKEELMQLCGKIQIPFTLCPLSNLKLQVFRDLAEFPIKLFLEKGMLIMLNSDDPAYFGGYIGDNYLTVMENCRLSLDSLVLLAKNSFEATFLGKERKKEFIKMVDDFFDGI
jgi:adenosine deaminase